MEEVRAPMAPSKIPPGWPILLCTIAGWALIGLGGWLVWSFLTGDL